MLTVSVKSDDVGHFWLRGYVVKTCLKRSALAKVEGVSQNSRPCVFCDFGTAIGASIIYAHNVHEMLGQFLDYRTDYFGFVKQRNNNPRVGFSLITLCRYHQEFILAELAS